MKSWVHFLGGSVTVYLLMAACSAGAKRVGSHGDEPSAAAGMTASGGAAQATGGDAMASAGTSAPSSSGNGGGMIDDMMDPVDDADAAPATSGTRLRARYYVGEDGSKQFIGWFDKQREEPCTIQKADDGKLRCLPALGAFVNYFSDAGCTTPLGIASSALTCAQSPAPAPTYVADLNTYTCSAALKFYKVGAEVTPTAVYTGTPAACAAAATVPTYYRFFSTTPASAAEFVAANEQVE